MDQQTIISGVLGLLFFGALAFAFIQPTNKDKAKKRAAAIEQARPGRKSTAAAGAAGAEASTKDRRRKLTEALAKVDDRTKKHKKKKRLSLQQQIEQAGLSFSPRHFYIGSVVSAIACVFIGFISGQKLPIIGLLFVIGGLGLPRWFILFSKARRQKKFANEFSNAIDVIVRGVKSGLPVNECLKIIASEAPKPVNEEFHMMNEGLRVGLSLEQTLDRMFDRMPLQEVRFFGIVLMIQQKTGGNLAEALGNLANVLRGRKLMEGKIKALSSEAKASAMIIGSLPFLVMGSVQLASPDYLTPLFSTPTGNMILLGAGLWMGTGVFVMNRMIKIKV